MEIPERLDYYNAIYNPYEDLEGAPSSSIHATQSKGDNYRNLTMVGKIHLRVKKVKRF